MELVHQKIIHLSVFYAVGKQNKRNSGLLAVPVPILHISYNAESFWDSLIVFCLDPH